MIFALTWRRIWLTPYVSSFLQMFPCLSTERIILLSGPARPGYSAISHSKPLEVVIELLSDETNSSGRKPLSDSTVRRLRTSNNAYQNIFFNQTPFFLILLKRASDISSLPFGLMWQVSINKYSSVPKKSSLKSIKFWQSPNFSHDRKNSDFNTL